MSTVRDLFRRLLDRIAPRVDSPAWVVSRLDELDGKGNHH
jgi:hypothetical protein